MKFSPYGHHQNRAEQFAWSGFIFGAFFMIAAFVLLFTPATAVEHLGGAGARIPFWGFFIATIIVGAHPLFAYDLGACRPVLGWAAASLWAPMIAWAMYPETDAALWVFMWFFITPLYIALYIIAYKVEEKKHERWRREAASAR